MDSFKVLPGNLELICSWDVANGDHYGEIIFNNLDTKTYKKEVINHADFTNPIQAEREYRQAVTNGVAFNVRLITYTINGAINRNVVRSGIMGQTVPSILSELTLTAVNKAILVNLGNSYTSSPSQSNGFSPITKFEVLMDNGNNSDVLQVFDVSLVQNKSFLITNMLDFQANQAQNRTPALENGKEHEIVVRAVNANGSGELTIAKYATPNSTTQNVTDFTGVPGNASILLTWTPPAVDLSGATYGISQKLSSATEWGQPLSIDCLVDISGDMVPVTEYQVVSCLSNGTAYDFRISTTTPVNGISNYAYTYNIVPFTVPGAMVDANVEITDLSNSSIRVKLTPPANNGGKAIVAYEFFIQGDLSMNWAAGSLASDLSKTFIVYDLSLGEPVMFNIYAMNSAQRNPVFSKEYTQYSNPGAVELSGINDSAAASQGEVKLDWVLPTNMGGEIQSMFSHEITHNTYDLSNGVYISGPNANVPAGSLLTARITNLVFGKSYTFRVKSSFTENGVTFVSPNSNAVTVVPSRSPAPPVPSIVMDGANMKFSWVQPELYGLVLSKYQYAIRLKSSQGQTPAPFDYRDISAGLLNFSVTPLAYGKEHELSMKTFTKLSGSADLESVVSAVESHTPYKAPGAVSSLDLYPTDDAFEVKWNPPTDENKGGYTDIRYKVFLNLAVDPSNSLVSGNRARVQISDKGENYVGVQAIGYLNGVAGLVSAETLTKSNFAYYEPASPTDLALEPGDAKIKLTWVAPPVTATGEDAPTISYIIFKNGVRMTGVDLSVTTYTDMDVANRLEYKYRVVTKQTYKDGNNVTYSDNFTVSSDEKTAIPFKAPEAPANLVLSGSDKQIDASWAQVQDVNLNGLSSPAKYQVKLIDASTNVILRTDETPNLSVTFTTYDLSGVIMPLVNGVTYNVEVRTMAENKQSNVTAGWYTSSAKANGTVVPNVKPQAPVNPIAVPQDGKIRLTWSAPSSDGYTTQSYRVWKNEETSSKTTLAADASSCLIEGLNNGTTYKVSIERVASGLVSDTQSVSGLVPFGLPILGAVTTVTVDGKKQVSVKINPNGARLIDFFVFAAPAVYNVNNTLLHKSSPINPQPTEITGEVTQVSTQLNVAGDLSGALCIVTNAAGASQKQQAF